MYYVTLVFFRLNLPQKSISYEWC